MWRPSAISGLNPLWDGAAARSDATMSGTFGVMGWFVCDVVRRRWRGAACLRRRARLLIIGAGAARWLRTDGRRKGVGDSEAVRCTAPTVGHRPYLPALRSLAWAAG